MRGHSESTGRDGKPAGNRQVNDSTDMKHLLKSGLLVMLTVFLALGMSVVPAAAQNQAINYSADAAPQSEFTGNVTIDGYSMTWDGLQYENDSGEVVDFPGEVNSSVDNPYSYVASDVNFSDAGAFPHANENVSALDAAEWTTSSATVADTETASGVEALEISASPASGSSGTATFDLTAADSAITSDENKRYLQMVLDVNTLESGATVNVSVVDEDGDSYTATIDPSRSEGDDLIASATGEGMIYQQQLGDMTLETAGDGQFNNIQTVDVTIADASAGVAISALNLDKTSTWTFGEQKVDTDDDDELETETIEETKTGGAISVHDLSTLGDTFSDAEFAGGLDVEFRQTAEHLDSEDVSTGFESADQYASYEQRFNMFVRHSVPDAYDLSYSGLELEDTVSVPGTRYVTVEYAENVGDTAFGDIGSWSSITGQYDNLDKTLTVDDTVSPGTSMAIHYDYVLTGDEADSLQNTGGAMGPTGGSGGFLDTLFSIPGMIVSAFVAFFSGRKIGVF